jgi:hypothetical protein
MRAWVLCQVAQRAAQRGALVALRAGPLENDEEAEDQAERLLHAGCVRLLMVTGIRAERGSDRRDDLTHL